MKTESKTTKTRTARSEDSTSFFSFCVFFCFPSASSSFSSSCFFFLCLFSFTREDSAQKGISGANQASNPLRWAHSLLTKKTAILLKNGRLNASGLRLIEPSREKKKKGRCWLSLTSALSKPASAVFSDLRWQSRLWLALKTDDRVWERGGCRVGKQVLFSLA